MTTLENCLAVSPEVECVTALRSVFTPMNVPNRNMYTCAPWHMHKIVHSHTSQKSQIGTPLLHNFNILLVSPLLSQLMSWRLWLLAGAISLAWGLSYLHLTFASQLLWAEISPENLCMRDLGEQENLCWRDHPWPVGRRTPRTMEKCFHLLFSLVNNSKMHFSWPFRRLTAS